MTTDERIAACQQAMKEKNGVGLSLDDVRRVDRFLASRFGIVPPLRPSSWSRKLRKLAGPSLSGGYRAVHDAYASYLESGCGVPEEIDVEWYDLIADTRIASHIHSQKRTSILDEACFLLLFIRMLQIKGPVLDVGCHTGHHAITLAHETGLDFVGIDRSRRAIEQARRYARSNNVAVTFTDERVDSSELTNSFEMVYATRSLELSEATAGIIATALKPGGIAVFVPTTPPDFDREEAAAIQQNGLGWLYADVVGGYVGEERGYEAGAFLVFIKGGDDLIPSDCVDLATEAWSTFQPYANMPDTPANEKTQAYCRARRMCATK